MEAAGILALLGMFLIFAFTLDSDDGSNVDPESL
jgi:hypothetical protein